MKKSMGSMKALVAGVVFFGGFVVSQGAFAQASAKEGLNTISLNLDNTKANLTEYKKNLSIVDENITEVSKAKAKAVEQQRSVASQVETNNKSVSKVDAQEKELNQLMADEKAKSAGEEKKIAELEAAIAKMRDNQKKREANVSDYQLQITQLQEEKKVWTSRAQILKEQQQDVAQIVKAVASDEAQWKNKQKGYQGEVARWNKEVDRQQKIYDSYSALAGK